MDARAGSLWHKTAGEAIPQINPRHRGGPVCHTMAPWTIGPWTMNRHSNYHFDREITSLLSLAAYSSLAFLFSILLSFSFLQKFDTDIINQS